ncbi:Arm DNA-binding domain-containing protein [Aquimarina sp. RZ0]|uniref:Arm DNA-binding domain-containing protein n=1 Tax=Aquimarina sp. RZ0 TaxID=2607730 RepID=UPI002106617D|nr:Arm DNA-binding domain-containing protein [Aquimarina sp. RZ0]
MNVTLRKQTLKDGRQSLFLDYYLPKAKQTRKKEALKLYLYPNPKSKSEKEHNKKISLLAESIRSKRLLQLQHEDHDFSHLIKDKDTSSERSFIAFLESLLTRRLTKKELMGYGTAP